MMVLKSYKVGTIASMFLSISNYHSNLLSNWDCRNILLEMGTPYALLVFAGRFGLPNGICDWQGHMEMA